MIGPSDTQPDIERLRSDLLRRMSPAQKLELLGGLNDLLRQTALAGLRRQFPHASEAAIRRRLADRLLGPELAEQVYGPHRES